VRPGAAAVALAVAGAIGVGALQPRLARTVRSIKQRDDVYALPPPAQLHAATLGWDAAAVDLLWAKLLVEYGTHWSEHRELKDVGKYADAILELEPSYAPLYRTIDTMLAYRPMQGTEEDVRAARRYLERGAAARKDDAELRLEYGQFLAFIAPSFLHDAAERDAWRRDGAAAIGEAVELGADADRALSAASILSQTGATAEAIHYLERAYAFTEHPSMAEVHEAIGRKLASLQATAVAHAADDAARAIDDRWKRELPYVPRDRFLLMGPVPDTLRCTGIDGYGAGPCDRPECCREWQPLVDGTPR
jgi:hypothetical protein